MLGLEPWEALARLERDLQRAVEGLADALECVDVRSSKPVESIEPFQSRKELLHHMELSILCSSDGERDRGRDLGYRNPEGKRMALGRQGMDEFDEIELLLGAPARQYAENKRRGGDNNEKGLRFERMHALNEIARLASEHLLEIADHRDARLRSQVRCFVDDLEVETRTETTRSQVKDVENLSWNSGDHWLSDDFRLEKQYAVKRKSPVSLRLVVSDELICARMLKSRPIDLSFVAITANGTGYIPDDVVRFPTLMEHLKTICLPMADTETLRNAAYHLMFGWDSHRQNASLQQILAEASTLSQLVVRTTERDAVIDDTTLEILNSIDDFVFVVRGETLSYWTCDGLMKGVAPFKFGSTGWEKFLDGLYGSAWDEDGRTLQIAVEDVIRLIRRK